jgi:hypothetical protein
VKAAWLRSVRLAKSPTGESHTIKGMTLSSKERWTCFFATMR